MTVALERLLDLYMTDRQADETATAFFRRVDVARVKGVLSDLEQMTPASTAADDYIRPRRNRRIQAGNSRRRM